MNALDLQHNALTDRRDDGDAVQHGAGEAPLRVVVVALLLAVPAALVDRLVHESRVVAQDERRLGRPVVLADDVVLLGDDEEVFDGVVEEVGDLAPLLQLVLRLQLLEDVAAQDGVAHHEAAQSERREEERQKLLEAGRALRPLAPSARHLTGGHLSSRSNGVTSGRPLAHRRSGTSRFPGERVRQQSEPPQLLMRQKAIAT